MSGIKATWPAFNDQFYGLADLPLTQARVLLASLEKIIKCEEGIDRDHWCPRCKSLYLRVMDLGVHWQLKQIHRTLDRTRETMKGWSGKPLDLDTGCGGCGSTSTPTCHNFSNGNGDLWGAHCRFCGWGVLDKPSITEAVKAYWMRVSKEGKRRAPIRPYIDPETHLPEDPGL